MIPTWSSWPSTSRARPAALATLGIPFLLLGPPVDAPRRPSPNWSVVGLATGHGPADRDTGGGSGGARSAASSRRSSGPPTGSGAARVYHEVDETLYSATSATFFIGDLYFYNSVVNIADAAEAAGPFPQLSPEFIIDQNPDFIFLGDAAFGVTVEAVTARAGWETIAAVSGGNVVPLDGDIAGRWGPRTVDLMRVIFEAVEASLP